MRFVTFFCLTWISLGASAQTDSRLVADAGSAPVSRRTNVPTDYRSHSDDQLLVLIKEAPISQRAEIATELVERKSVHLSTLFQSLIKEHETYLLTMGSISYETTTAGELFSAVARQKEKAERKSYYEKTNSSAKQSELQGLFGRDYSTKWTVAESESFLSQLSGMALSSNDTHPRTLNQILELLDYRYKDYGRIATLARKYPTPELLAALATFKKPQDAAFLKSRKSDAYLAFSKFPDPSFVETLKAAPADDRVTSDYQQAVCAFRNAQGKSMLENLCREYAAIRNKTDRDDQLFALYTLMEKQNCPLFAPVMKKIDALMAQP